jgi:hypothetical protein
MVSSRSVPAVKRAMNELREEACPVMHANFLSCSLCFPAVPDNTQPCFPVDGSNKGWLGT